MRFFRHGTLIQQNEKDFKRVFYTTIEYNLNFKLKIFYVLLIHRFVFHNGKYGVSLNEVMLEHELCMKWMLREEEDLLIERWMGRESKGLMLIWSLDRNRKLHTLKLLIIEKKQAFLITGRKGSTIKGTREPKGLKLIWSLGKNRKLPRCREAYGLGHHLMIRSRRSCIEDQSPHMGMNPQVQREETKICRKKYRLLHWEMDK